MVSRRIACCFWPRTTPNSAGSPRRGKACPTPPRTASWRSSRTTLARIEPQPPTGPDRRQAGPHRGDRRGRGGRPMSDFTARLGMLRGLMPTVARAGVVTFGFISARGLSSPNPRCRTYSGRTSTRRRPNSQDRISSAASCGLRCSPRPSGPCCVVASLTIDRRPLAGALVSTEGHSGPREPFTGPQDARRKPPHGRCDRDAQAIGRLQSGWVVRPAFPAAATAAAGHRASGLVSEMGSVRNGKNGGDARGSGLVYS